MRKMKAEKSGMQEAPLRTVSHPEHSEGSAVLSLSPLKRTVQLALLVLVVIFAVGATDANIRFDKLGHAMMCQCGCSQVLLECNHVGCTTSDRMRAEMTAALTNGDSDDRILKQFVEKYGSVVLAAPTTTGFNRVAWIMPYFALAFGMALCAFFVRAWKHRRPALAAPAVSAPVDPRQLDSYRERVHQETEL
jgi:cytochrome c-type biogenesis protein CcmH/NrfF